MVAWLTRADWGARPPESKVPLVRSQVRGIVIHWPGMSQRIDAAGAAGKERVAAALRGWQRFHMDVRGWRDIAYQAAVDQAGRKWTLRGLNLQSGANGNEAVNDAYGAVLLILGPGEDPSPAMEATTREVIAEFREWFPAGTLIRPHSAVRPDGTDCPGIQARAAIARGDFTPGTDTGEDEVTPAQMNQLLGAIGALKTSIDAIPARIESSIKSDVDASGRKWALYGVLYGLETEDDREAARTAYQEVYTAKLEAGVPKQEAELAAMKAAEAKLATLRQGIKEAQGNA